MQGCVAVSGCASDSRCKTSGFAPFFMPYNMSPTGVVALDSVVVNNNCVCVDMAVVCLWRRD